MSRLLGRVPSRRDTRTLTLRRYLAPNALPAAPPSRDWPHPATAPAWGLYRNSELGDCTCAAIGHMLQAAAANTGRPPPPITDADVVALYRQAGGYDPARPETDQGAQMIDVLRLMRDGGLAGRKIGAFAALDPASRVQVEAAVNLFGAAYVGVDLPIAAQTQTVWDVSPAGRYDASYQPGSWGGHAMALLGYDRTHVTFVTWAAVKVATVEWFMTYCGEAWAVIDPLWIGDAGLAPSGFNAELLAADLAQIGAAR